MKSDKSQPPKPKREFGGCIELIPARPDYTEFIDAHRIWGFPIRQLEQFVLEENPHHENKRTSPPDQLLLVYPEALVFLRGCSSAVVDYRQTSTMRKESKIRIISKIVFHKQHMVGALSEGLHHGPPEYHRSGRD